MERDPAEIPRVEDILRFYLALPVALVPDEVERISQSGNHHYARADHNTFRALNILESRVDDWAVLSVEDCLRIIHAWATLRYKPFYKSLAAISAVFSSRSDELDLDAAVSILTSWVTFDANPTQNLKSLLASRLCAFSHDLSPGQLIRVLSACACLHTRWPYRAANLQVLTKKLETRMCELLNRLDQNRMCEALVTLGKLGAVLHPCSLHLVNQRIIEILDAQPFSLENTGKLSWCCAYAGMTLSKQCLCALDACISSSKKKKMTAQRASEIKMCWTACGSSLSEKSLAVIHKCCSQARGLKGKARPSVIKK